MLGVVLWMAGDDGSWTNGRRTRCCSFMSMGFLRDYGWECDEFGVGLGKVKMV